MFMMHFICYLVSLIQIHNIFSFNCLILKTVYKLNHMSHYYEGTVFRINVQNNYLNISSI